MAACNIRWVKLNDGRKNACQVAGWFSSPLTHDCLGRGEFHYAHGQCVHGSQRIHVISPMHDFTIAYRDDRDEPVNLESAGRDRLAMHLIFKDDYARILASMHDEFVRVVQDDIIAIASI